jgi:hypothetical protein
MYQTVGQDAIELVAQALDVPLYRRVIAGSALAQGSEYGSRKANVSQPSSSGIIGDETEDLYQLLLTVKVSVYLAATIMIFSEFCDPGIERMNIPKLKAYLSVLYYPTTNESAWSMCTVLIQPSCTSVFNLGTLTDVEDYR